MTWGRLGDAGLTYGGVQGSRRAFRDVGGQEHRRAIALILAVAVGVLGILPDDVISDKAQSQLISSLPPTSAERP